MDPLAPRLSHVALLSLLALAGCHKSTPVSTTTTKGGLATDPQWLTFQCIKPGCDTSQKVTVTQVGERHIAVKRVVLDDATRTDFTVALDQGLAAPFVVPGDFVATVRYLPQAGLDTDSTDVNLLVDYTDASADDSPDRVAPGELSIPLLRRLVGEADMIVTPSTLVFGAAFNGDALTQTLTIQNSGFGNISLDIASIDSDNPDVVPAKLATSSLAPGEKMDVPVTFTANDSEFISATLTVKPVDPAIAPVKVTALATSLYDPQIAADPPTVDFGELPRHHGATVQVQLLNQGGAELDITRVAVAGTPDGGVDPNVTASLPDGGVGAALQPLQIVPLSVQLTAQVAGPVASTVNVMCNAVNAKAKTFPITVTATVTEPQATPTPATVDFGQVFQGWTQTLPLAIENTGYGDLTILGITLVGGTSDLFTLHTLPVLPATLHRSQRLGLEVDFRADALATFTGAVSIESDDPNNNFLQVPLKAVGTTCDQACPLLNAVADCSSGGCAIQTCTADTDCGTDKCNGGECCAAGWWDTDGDLSNGCECNDPNDNGPFCADATDLGQMTPNHNNATYTGVLPTAADVDTVKFSTDSAGWFSSITVNATLTSSDPDITMDVLENSNGDCPTSVDKIVCSGCTTFQSSDENAAFLMTVSRKSGTKPSCTSYTVTVTHNS